MECKHCGKRMIPLLTSLVCPDDCTRSHGPLCPDCKSNNTEEFDISGILDCFAADDVVHDSVTYHCWPCGNVWNIERERPETD